MNRPEQQKPHNDHTEQDPVLSLEEDKILLSQVTRMKQSIMKRYESYKPEHQAIIASIIDETISRVDQRIEELQERIKSKEDSAS